MQVSSAEAQLISRVLHRYGEIEISAVGTSMFPFIKEGDVCTFTPCDSTSLLKGDVLLFFTSTGKLVAHRFIEKKGINNVDYFFCKGDTNLGHDEPILERNLIGKLISVQKRNWLLHSESTISRFWRLIIIKLPILSYLLRLYLNRKVAKYFWGGRK